MDLTRNESTLLDGFESQIFALGTEYKLLVWKIGLAFRGGMYLNTVSAQSNAPYSTLVEWDDHILQDACGLAHAS